MKVKPIVIPLILFALLVSSCGNTTAPEDLLEEDRYIDVFSELLVVNQMEEEQLDGVSRDYLKEQVFEEYNVTQKQFEQSHRYYQKQPDEQLRRLDKIEKQLTDQREMFQDRLDEERKQLADSLIGSDTLSQGNAFNDTTDSSTFKKSELLYNDN